MYKVPMYKVLKSKTNYSEANKQKMGKIWFVHNLKIGNRIGCMAEQ